MIRSTVASVRCPADWPLRRRWYRSLAQALAAARPPCGALFEATSTDPVPTVTVRPASLIATVRAAPVASALPLECGAVPPPPAPAAPGRERYAVIVPAGSAPPGAGAVGSVGRDRPLLASLLGPADWIGWQTFWLRGSGGEIRVARRFRYVVPPSDDVDTRFDGVAAAVVAEWTDATGLPAAVGRPARGAARDWRRGTVRSIVPGAWIACSADAVDRTAEFRGGSEGSAGPEPRGHAIVFGASGAGKTTFLAHRAAGSIRRGEPVIAIDLHGDLAPAIVAQLTEAQRATVVAVDATDRPVSGIGALAAESGDDDRAAGHLVAALKRLTPDGTDVYWGFRLERIFDSFVRLVQETGGSLRDLYGLLTDADRRDAARWATRRPDLARFLDELGPVVRRNPEFLWSAATRLSKVVLVPALAELLAPPDGGIPVEARIAEGSSLLVRLPFAALGPEAAAFAATLVLGRVYLGLAGRFRTGRPRTALVVLDEAQAFPPRLVAELLTESRKFGLRALVATQYPERLAPELRAAAAGVVGELVVFRIPRASAGNLAGWLGLSSAEAERTLPELPDGHGIVRAATADRPIPLAPVPSRLATDFGPWNAAVAATRRAADASPEPADGDPDAVTERLLLAVLGAEEEERPLGAAELSGAAVGLPGPALDAAAVIDRVPTLERQGLVRVAPDGLRLTLAGERRLGLGAATGATRESAEHRALLFRAFRIFARRGYRLEIVRQGRYDTTLPDARLSLLTAGAIRASPAELAGEIDRARRGWAWRCFRGRNVHVEAEVSGALRAERIRHGWSKAARHDAFALFLVPDPRRAGRVRATLRSMGIGPDRAQVWTLDLSGSRRPPRPLVA